MSSKKRKTEEKEKSKRRKEETHVERKKEKEMVKRSPTSDTGCSHLLLVQGLSAFHFHQLIFFLQINARIIF